MVPINGTSSDLLQYCNEVFNGKFKFNKSDWLSNRDGSTDYQFAPSPVQVWGIGLVFVTLISCCAAVGIALMPLLSKHMYNRLLTYFVGLGVGSLSGSAVFHLIPQGFELVGDGASHGYLLKAWVVVLGIYLFFFTDKFLQLIMKLRKKSAGGAQSGNTDVANGAQEPRHDHTSPNSAAYLLPSDSVGHGQVVRIAINGHVHDSTETAAMGADSPEKKIVFEVGAPSPCKNMSTEQSSADVAAQMHAMCAHEHDVQYREGDSVIGTVAWMVIFGDGLHNFIDGLSIGAAFSKSVLSGVSISVAVLCEEFPHELGDVGILISAGMTIRQALTYNLLSAATCYLGFVIGVMLGELADASVYIFALAGGMFLYISLASMIPEMSAAVEKQLSRSTVHGLRTLALQTAGVATGLSAMFLMAYFGASIRFD